MNKNAGSYDFANFGRAQEEFERLKIQAEVAAPFDKKITQWHGLKPDMKILEMGCGPGFVSRTLASLAPDGQVVGCDISDELLTVANDYNKKYPIKNLSFIKGDIYDMSSLEESFDFIYSRFVFQHLDRPQDAFMQLKRLLKPNGRLVVFDVDDQLVVSYPQNPILDKIYQLQNKYQKNLGGDRYIGRKLATYFKNTGFNDIKINVVTVSNIDIGMKMFLDLSTGYKLMLLENEGCDLTQKAIDLMYEQMQDGLHFATIGIYTVSACP